MLEKYIRPTFQDTLVDKLIHTLLKSNKISPNQCTLAAGMVGFLAFLAIVNHMNYWAVGLLFVSGFFDVLDGSLARASGKVSAFGSVLDIVVDRIVESLILLGLFLVLPEQRALECLGMLIAILLCVTSFLVVGIFSENDSEKSFYYSPGLIERFEAFIFFALMILFPAAFSVLASCFIVLVLLTTIIRIWEFSKQA